MILILNVLKKNKATWLLEKNQNKLSCYDFSLEAGSERILFYLDLFLKKEKVKIEDIKSLVFLVKEASLTQVKVLTAIVDTMAWQFDWPTVAKFYFSEDWQLVLLKAKKELALKKGWQPLKAKYQRKVDITLSKKKQKYKIGA